jgi:hypothetical protein
MLPRIRFFVCMSLSILLYSPSFSYGQGSRKSKVLNRLSGQQSVLSYIGFPDQPSPSAEIRRLLERQVRWDDAKAGELNPSGFQLRFVKIDEPGTPGNGAVARYRVIVAGAPENKIYGLESWPLDKEIVTDPREVYVNMQGLLMIHRPTLYQETNFKAPGDELVVTPVTGSAEPMRYVFSSRDSQLQVFGALVPHPVIANDRGCVLEVRIAQPDATAVLIVVNRFPEGAKIPVVLESEGATASEILTMNADGHAVLAAFPYVPGKMQGMLRVTAEGPSCLPAVVLPWGPAAPPAAKIP